MQKDSVGVNYNVQSRPYFILVFYNPVRYNILQVDMLLAVFDFLKEP